MKLAVPEPETEALRRLLHEDPDQATSAIASVEVVRVVRRRDPALVSDAERVVRRLTAVEPGEPIRARAAALEPAELRSLDALHLATALELGEEVAGFVTYDRRLAVAAASAGLPVLAPGP